MSTSTPEIAEETPAPTTRDAIRSAVLGLKAERRSVRIAGMNVEVQQPTVGEILSVKNEDDNSDAMIRMIIDHVYVPGTSEKVFELADRDILKSLPFTDDFTRLSVAISGMTGINIEEGEADLRKNPT